MMGISIAGFDPSGGAGIIEDMKIFNSLGIHGTGVITALTAQNPSKVFSLQPIATSYIEEQIDSIFNGYDDHIRYGKTGMLYSEDIIKIVAEKIIEYDLKVVVDPVMVASAGGLLSKEKNDKIDGKDSIAIALKKYLLPHCLITTPNIHEAEILSEKKIYNQDDAIDAAEKIGKICDVVITGGHLDGINTLSINGEIAILEKNLLQTDNFHGSGCAFSGAIASYMIKGENLKSSIEKSLDFIEIAIDNGRYGTLNPIF